MRERIQHIITGLNVGGAELILSKLVCGAKAHEHTVTSLSGNGVVGRRLFDQGVDVELLAMRKDPRAIRNILELSASLSERSPHLVQTWLYHADLAGGLAARRSGIPVVWNLRQTDVGRRVHKFNTRVVIRLCALLSKSIPIRIVCGSTASLSVHRRLGYDDSKMTVIKNGVDIRAFQPDRGAGDRLKDELQVAPGDLLVGRVGRFHPQKDYRTFVEMASYVAGSRDNVVFVMIGSNINASNKELVEWIERAGLGGKCRLLGQRTDIAAILPGLDVLVSSSSFGEGFPNVIAEAMSCGVPCVATDVGDSAEIVGDKNRILAPYDSEGLAKATLDLLNTDSATLTELKARARERVVESYDIMDMIGRYEELYNEILHGSFATGATRSAG